MGEGVSRRGALSSTEPPQTTFATFSMTRPLNHQNSEHIVEVRTIRTIGWFLRENALSQPTSHHVCDSNILISSHSQSICRLAQDFGWLGISDLDYVNVDKEFVVTRIHLAQPAAEAS